MKSEDSSSKWIKDYKKLIILSKKVAAGSGVSGSDAYTHKGSQKISKWYAACHELFKKALSCEYADNAPGYVMIQIMEEMMNKDSIKKNKIRTVGELREKLALCDDSEGLIFDLEDNGKKVCLDCVGVGSSGGGRLAVIWLDMPKNERQGV